MALRRDREKVRRILKIYERRYEYNGGMARVT
jgi:hypothetical protein